MNFKRKIISYILIWSVVIGSLLSYSPETHVLSATGVPEINLISPVGKSVFDVSKVEFTGKISDDLTSPNKLLFKVFEYTGESEQPIDITSEGLLTLTPKDQYAEFSYSKDFSQGDHKLSFIVTDEDGFSSISEQTITVQLSGITGNINKLATPVIGKLSVTQSPSGVNVNQTSSIVNTEATISDVTNDSNRPYLAKMYLIPRDTESNYNPVGEVPSTYLPVEDMTRVPLNYIVLFDIRSSVEFNPTQPLISYFGDNKGKEKLIKTVDLSGEMKAYLYTYTPNNELNPAQSYSVYMNPNELIPRFLTFTTVSNNYEKYQFEGDKGSTVREHDYIHGPFSVVTNACDFCHSAHNGNNEYLEGDPNGKHGDELCMACHDGTNGSPSIDSNYANNKHHNDTGASCATCHDPHNPGTKDNPNSLKKATYNGSTRVLSYKKSSDATGSVNDFSQCLSCHNGTKASNIEQYYQDTTLKNQSGHNIVATVDSGSSLNGQIPCAECHETHGSSNLKMLREDLGNVKITDDKKKYKSSGTEWNALNEREFCLKCHNNSTQIYGKTSPMDLTISGHQTDETQGCSSCHGGESKSFMDAAHAPKKLTTP